MIEIKDENFNEKVIKLHNNSKFPFILYFYSDNCKYCYLAENILNLLLNKFNKKFFIYKINTKNRNIVEKYNIKGTPSILLFDENLNLIDKAIGQEIEYNKLESFLIENIKEKVVFFKFLKLF